jgi:AraC family transcriptional regulator of adaptative response / DNA-3-methyladenine glycosylase II
LLALVRAHGHATPAALLRRERVRVASRRLIERDERASEAGPAAGFESEASFHRQFLALTGLTPGAYRALRESTGFLIQLPPGHRTREMLRYHGRDPDGPGERLRGDSLVKGVVLDGTPLELEMRLRGGAVWCEPRLPRGKRSSPELMAAVHEAAARMLGLSSDAPGFEARARRAGDIARLVAGRRGLRVPLAAQPFEALAWSILGQQINIAFALTLRREVIEHAGPAAGGSAGLRAFPPAADVAALTVEALTARRFSRSKAEYLIGAARTVAAGALPLEQLAGGSACAAEERLRSIRGIGPWTAHYVMMRGLAFADCVPLGDSGLIAGLRCFYALDHRPDASETATLMAPFSPHRSLATFHLWALPKTG